MSTAAARREYALPERWRLEAAPGDAVEDVEALCVGAREEAYRRWPQILDLIDREEAMGILYETVWRRFLRYDGRGDLSGFLYDHLPHKLFDRWRAQHGRNGNGPRGREVLTDLRVDQADASDSGAHRLESGGRGPSDGWDHDLGGLLAEAHRGADGEVGFVGGETRRRVARVPARPGTGTGGGVDGGGSGSADGGYWRDCECGCRVYAQAPNGQPGWHYPDFCPACRRSLNL